MALNQVGLERLNTATTKKIGMSKNLIINGAMEVAQRGTSSTSSGYHTVDRFAVYYTGTDEAPTQAQVDVASGTTPYTLGFRKALKITNGNQTGGAGAGDHTMIQTKQEAQDIANSGWNYTSASSYVTLSFWVKSSVAQNFYGYFRTKDGTEQRYAFETGSLSADTWTKITKTIPGNSNLQFDNDANQGTEINISPFMGTDYTDSGVSLNTWGAYSGSTRAPDYTSTWYTTNDATFEITGVQLEVGSTATDFEHRSFGQELLLCQRYYEKSYRYEDAVGSSSNNDGNIDIVLGSNSTGTVVYHLRFFEEKRANPTVTVYRPDTGASGQWLYGRSGLNSDNASVTVDSFSTKSCRAYFGIGSHNYKVAFLQGHYTAEAEL